MSLSLEESAVKAENFLKANNIEIYKGLLAASDNSNFITSYWDEEEDFNVENFLSIANKFKINMVYISKDIYHKADFEELRELYQGLLHK
jgi:effector-binding domain-containing protein